MNKIISAISYRNMIDVRNKAIVMMFPDISLRLSELANLELSDIDIHTGSILIRSGKGGK